MSGGIKRYGRKPTTVEAFRFIPTEPIHGAPIGDYVAPFGRECWFLKTLEGDMRIAPGYYIVKGIAGEWWGVRPDIFEETYERLEDEDAS